MTAVYSDLAGKVVLVTGGASGIGAAIVRRFAQQKSNVVFFDIKSDEGEQLARELSDQGLSAHFSRVDVTDIAALRAGVAEARNLHRAINILVNNAAHDERHKTEEMTPEYWDDRIAVNPEAPVLCCASRVAGHEGGECRRHHPFRLGVVDRRRLLMVVSPMFWSEGRQRPQSSSTVQREAPADCSF